MRDIFKNVVHNCEMEDYSEIVDNNFDFEFAGNFEFAGEPITQEDELNNISDAIANERVDELSLDADGNVNLSGNVNDNSNFQLKFTKDGTFASSNMEKDFFFEDQNNIMNSDAGIILDNVEIQDNNMCKVNFSDGNFGAGFFKKKPSVPKSAHDQWYEKNPKLLEAEILAMKTRLPSAKYGFLKSNNNMYWICKAGIHKDPRIKPWTFLLVYDKDHPNNSNYGGSIKVYPMKPTYEELQERSRRAGRPIIPHILSNVDNRKYLCTRITDCVKSGDTEWSSAASAFGWAVEWAVYYELSLTNDKIWNLWVDDSHYREYKV